MGDNCSNTNKIVFFDLDGTLLDNNTDKLPQSTLKALNALKAGGVVTVLSTGRDMDTHYSVKYVDMVKPDAIIHSNGSKITIGERLLFDHVIDRKLLREVIDFAKEHDICVGTSVGGGDYYTVPMKKREADMAYNKYLKRNFIDIEELFTEDIKVHTLSFAGDISTEGKVLTGRFNMLSLLPFNTGIGADVIENGFTKADGMYKVCDYFGVPYDHTYAFGDSQNDLHILKAAEVGIAMGNADPVLKAAADYVTDAVDRDGIYNACVHFGLI